LQITAAAAATWEKAGGIGRRAGGAGFDRVGPGDAGAKRAVIWLSKAPGEGNRQQVQVALIGDAKVVQRDATRSAERLLVTSLVSGKVRFTADTRVEDDRSDTELYESAERLRREER
jgi:hypothetical protein